MKSWLKWLFTERGVPKHNLDVILNMRILVKKQRNKQNKIPRV